MHHLILASFALANAAQLSEVTISGTADMKTKKLIRRAQAQLSEVTISGTAEIKTKKLIRRVHSHTHGHSIKEEQEFDEKSRQDGIRVRGAAAATMNALGNVQVAGLQANTSHASTSKGVIVIENEHIGVEIDLDHGCSISGAWASGDLEKTNLINTHDLDRYVQVSYYSGPAPYAGCSWRGQDWNWNPIGAGDVYKNPAQIISASQLSGTTAVCTVRPIQWACCNVLCNCTVDLKYSLDGNALVANATLQNNRSDKTVYPARNQELPAVYTNGPFYRLLGYTGNEPCTGGELTEWIGGFDPKDRPSWVPGRIDTVTEPVLSLVNEAGFGLGVYSSLSHTFLAGFAGGAKGSGGTKDNPTGYIAPLHMKALAWNEKYKYAFALVIGNLTDIRKKACKLAVLDGFELCNWQCYLNRYPGLQKAFGANNIAAAAGHYEAYGKREGRTCTC